MDNKPEAYLNYRIPQVHYRKVVHMEPMKNNKIKEK